MAATADRPETARAGEAPARARLDVWLWRARVVKTRALAVRLVKSGHVRVNGAKEKAPGRGLLVGDVLTVALDRDVRVLRIADFGERRGPATEARGLYDDLAAPAAAAPDPSGAGDL